PIEIVSDPQRPDHRVETGLSCMSCHSRGILPKVDQVRAHVVKNKKAFLVADVDAVLALYPPKERLQKLVEEDNEKYGRAVAKLGLALDAEDPVNVVTRRFEGSLDLAAAAAELGVSAEWFRKMLDAKSAQAKALGVLAVKGGTVTREAFEDAFPTLLALAAPAWSPTPRNAKDDGVYTGQRSVHAIALSQDGKRGAIGQGDRELLVFAVE